MLRHFSSVSSTGAICRLVPRENPGQSKPPAIWMNSRQNTMLRLGHGSIRFRTAFMSLNRMQYTLSILWFAPFFSGRFELLGCSVLPSTHTTFSLLHTTHFDTTDLEVLFEAQDWFHGFHSRYRLLLIQCSSPKTRLPGCSGPSTCFSVDRGPKIMYFLDHHFLKFQLFHTLEPFSGHVVSSVNLA